MQNTEPKIELNTEPKIVYRFKQALYINLTNRCPNACVFCLKTKFAMRFENYNLNLCGREPSSEEVLEEIYKGIKEAPIKEVVFCGYGEPTMRLNVLLEVAKTLKEKMAKGELAKFKIRLNTMGMGNLVYGRDITSELAQVLDSINISINSPDEEEWKSIVRPQKEYAKDGYKSVLNFIKQASAKIDDVVVSIVDKQGIDAKKTEELAKSLGAKFYLREYIDAKK
ncbi:MAG: TatD family nuclease-associated radical SAM protein [Elusimicrobiota bacterium]|jgi:TatD DNase family protein|nr:TatD family nuclease-associated radical SAM protein [Elusimicrobiota bacterium]